MKLLRTATALVLTALVFTACDSLTGVSTSDLAGMWDAEEFSYTDNTGRTNPVTNEPLSLDVISDLNGALALDVDENGAFTGTVTIPTVTVDTAGNTVPAPVGGTLTVDGDSLKIDFDAATEALGFFGDFGATFTLEEDVLTFTNDATTFNFLPLEAQLELEPAGDVSATLQGRFVR